MDRRQRKTRKAILNACISLIEEKDFAKITVNDIANRADINRGTFYLHFLDKYDMMESFEMEMIEKIEEAIVKNLPEKPSNIDFIETRYDTLVQLLSSFEENKDLMRFILKANYASFLTKWRERLKQIVSQIILPKIEHLKYDVPFDLFVNIFTSLAMGLIEYQIQSDEPVNPEESAQLLFQILINGPAKTLGLLPEDIDNFFKQ